MKAYRIIKANVPTVAAAIRPLTSDPKVAASLRAAMSPQPNGDMLIYVESGDAFADIVTSNGTPEV